MKKLLSLCLFTAAFIILNAQGYYIEYKLSSSGGDEGNLSGFMKTYAQDGNSRMEMNMNIGGVGAMDMVSLSLKSSPNIVYLLNEKSKTYTELSSTDSEDWKDYPQNEYEVTLIGKEKVNGYTATHIKIRRKGSANDIEMWNTTEVSGYADLAALKTKYTGKSNLLKAMQAKGAEGFPVRIRVAEKRYTMQMDLVKAEKQSNPSSLFSLNSYTKASGNNAMPGNINVQEMMQNIQNMTPEEREKWIKQMEEQYKPRN
jgi:hypothetical protein